MLSIIVVLFVLNACCYGKRETPGCLKDHLIKEIESNLAELKSMKVHLSTSGNIPGETYVRWGRTKCPKDSSLVYRGYAGGNHYNQGGSGSNFLCLPEKPEWKEFTAGRGTYVGRIYGVEYDIGYNKPYSESFHDKDMPCAVCMTSRRPTVLMIPAKISCLKGWHKEYSGYLMSEMNSSGRTASQYICVDGKLESVPGGDKNQNQALVYPVEASCGQLKCDSSSYVEGRELTCVVCSK